jgi:hypothetical protein
MRATRSIISSVHVPLVPLVPLVPRQTLGGSRG